MGKYFSMYKWAKRKLGIKSQANIEAENQQTEPKTTSEEQPTKPKTLPDDVWKNILNILLSEPNVTKDVLNAFLNLEIPEEVDMYYDLKINKKLKLLELKRMSVVQPLSTLERTMTREQLYKQGNPRWAHDISAQAIGRVRDAREELDKVYLGGHVVDILDLLIGPSGRGCSHSDMCEIVGDLKRAHRSDLLRILLDEV
jgi:hypothetical protein